MNFFLKYFLRRKYENHVNDWHNPEDCIFCYISPKDQKKFLKYL